MSLKRAGLLQDPTEVCDFSDRSLIAKGFHLCFLFIVPRIVSPSSFLRHMLKILRVAPSKSKPAILTCLRKLYRVES